MALSILKILLFIIVALAILMGSHYFLYRSLVSFFIPINPALKHVLSALIILLPLSFIFSSLIAYFKQGWLVSAFYIFSSGWLGLFVNLFLAAVLIRLLVWLKVGFNTSTMAGIIFSLAVIFSVYGFWNAWQLQLKNITVKIKNLPPYWQGKTIIQLSDVHLGHIYGTEFLSRVVKQINSLNHELVLITGDLFDGLDGDLAGFIKPLEGIQSARGIYFVTGNHETYLGLEKAFPVLKKAGIKVLDNKAVNLEGLQLAGLSYPVSYVLAEESGWLNDAKDPLALLKEFDPRLPTILMRHVPTGLAQAKAKGIALQLSGHTHAGQQFPFSLITRLVFGKYHYGLNVDGDFTSYTASGVGTWGPPLRLGNHLEIVAIKLE